MGQYTIQRGDNLANIARRHNLSSWRVIYDHPENAQFRRDHPDPSRIFPGERLFIPEVGGGTQPVGGSAMRREAMRWGAARGRRVPTAGAPVTAADDFNIVLSDYEFGVRLQVTTPRTLDEMRRYVWPDGYSPPAQALLPAPTEGDEMMNRYNERYQGQASLSDRSPRYSQFLLNLTTFGHNGEGQAIWGRMRPELRQRILARSATPLQWPPWVPASLVQRLESWLASERATTAVVRFESSDFPGIAPHPAIVAYVHSGTAVDLQIYAELPDNPSYYERYGASSEAARLLADAAQQVNEDLFDLVNQQGQSPERARQRLAERYRNRLILAILEAIQIAAGGSSRLFSPPAGMMRPMLAPWRGGPRPRRVALDDALEEAQSQADELSAAGAAASRFGPRIRPVNGTVNVGGGLEAGAREATNLNPIVPGTGGPGSGAVIPNHVRAGFEDIGEIFEVGSVVRLRSNRLPYHTVDWARSARGAYAVMAPEGRVMLNVWTRSADEAQTAVRAFVEAGFRDVRSVGQGAGTMIFAVR